MKAITMTRDYSRFLSILPNHKITQRPLSAIETLGWQAFFAQQTDVDELVQTPPARVFEVHRNALHIVGDGIDQAIPPRAEVTVGDWVLLDPERQRANRVLERKSLIKRRAPGSDRQEQLIAANIDTAFIVSSCNQDFSIARLERYIALAFEAQITPVIVLTKTDLAPDQRPYVEQARSISDIIDVVALNATGEEPAQKLGKWCKPGQTVAFLGSSGVGKSTLTNALLLESTIRTQAIRKDDAKGRHTTTRRQLHMLPNGCLVLDTPGMRELQLTDAASGIEDVFADIQALSVRCRFNDCSHGTEPGCAVQRAIQNDELDPARLGRWRKLQAEDAFNSASLFERRTKDKAFGKMVRQATKSKNQRS